MQVDLLSVTQNAERLIAEAARVSRRKDGLSCSVDKDRATIRKLISSGHESVLEHASATFLVEGISRACLAQLTRHRLASFTVESQRYVNPLGGDQWVAVEVPRTLDANAYGIFLESVLSAQQAYSQLIRMGVPIEDARYVLPQAMPTRLVVTANFREWRHIISLRTAPEAQWEIRELARWIQEILVKEAPSVFEDLRPGEGHE
jgi:thymidylate synthase (FAD)